MTEQILECRDYKGRIVEKIYQDTSAKCLNGFLTSLLIWINKPHVANRRLVGTRLLSIFPYEYQETNHDIQHFLDDMNQKFCPDKDLTDDDDAHTQNASNANVKQIESVNHAQQQNPDMILSSTDRRNISVDDLISLSTSTSPHLVVIVRDLLPRQLNRDSTLREVITFDKLKNIFKFYPLVRFDKLNQRSPINNEIFYSFTFEKAEPQNRIVLNVTQNQEKYCMGTMSNQWLKELLLVKLSHWAGEDNLCTKATSLQTVSVDAYNKLYNELKAKYGPDLIEKWPERTDPQKFVYEDISIATFLLLVWQAERIETGCQKQSFVDLGCGNGLLVHLLSSEGHPGLGIDIQKRKIWDIYGTSTKLEVKTLRPSAENLFPEYDWIIGNHSDELTPWIPVIAARSSYHTRYFVLPCCFHDFDQKFSAKDHGISQYRTYLNYIRNIGEVCGFQVQEDILRIPSTKRVCFLGRKRTYTADEETEFDKQRSEFISHHCKKQKLEDLNPILNDSHLHLTKTGQVKKNESSISEKLEKQLDKTESWITGFQPRILPKTSGMCKNVPKEIKSQIINTVIEKLMSTENGIIITLSDGRLWHRGGVVPLSEIVNLFDSPTLQLLKKENGGLQTLIKNFSHIFQVSGSHVQLRDYREPWGYRSQSRNKEKAKSFKTALCWFHENHPDGCLLSQDSCTFAHGQNDLRLKDNVPNSLHDR